MSLKLSAIEIKYFKFYKNIKIEKIDGKNILLYGENGSGKSSLYFALEKLFCSYFRKPSILTNLEKDKNNNFNNSIHIKSKLTNDKTLSVYHRNQSYHTKTVTNLAEKQSIYFLNSNLLNCITAEANLFNAFDYLKSKFSCLDEVFEMIENIRQNINNHNTFGSGDKNEIVDYRRELDDKLNTIIESLNTSIRTILDFFKDDMNIQLKIEASEFDEAALEWKFITPKIIVLVDNNEDYKEILHEGKFRILSLAIFFALINESEKNQNDQAKTIKLLVLDDFLSSLDMANRMYVMKYIFEKYKEYQKIITTHNLTLFNVVKKLINVNRESDQWQYKNIFFKKTANYYVPCIYDKNDNYLEKAQEKFNSNEFELCGNLLRKELERIVSQIEIKLVTSDREKLSNIMDRIYTNENYALNAQDDIRSIENNIFNLIEKILKNSHLNSDEKIQKSLIRLETTLQGIKKINLTIFNKILNELNFHRDILLNKASHVSNEEHYRKEYKEALKEVKELQKIFNKLKF